MRRIALLATVVVLFAASLSARAGDEPLAARDVDEVVATDLPDPALDAYLGVVPGHAAHGVAVARVVPGSPADAAGVQAGDVVLALAGQALPSVDAFERVLAQLAPGARVDVVSMRGRKTVRTSARLAGRRPRDAVFRGGVFRLAVVPLTFRGERESVDTARLASAMFATTGATGAGASMSDYYCDQSYGRLGVTGQVLGAVSLPGARDDYAERPMGSTEGSAFAVAAAILSARMTAAQSREFDGIAFVYRAPAEMRAGFAFWPHRAIVSVHGRRVPYYVLGCGGEEGYGIGIHCHEFGHLLGLADAYGAGHRTGHGDFCLMALGHRGGARTGTASPFSLCAPCRVRLGWITPRVADPRDVQRIRLQPVESSADQVLLLPVSESSREHLLLEIRARRGFDAELPGTGLLVWRVGGAATAGQGSYALPVDLVEAHGIDVFDASLVRPDEIAFPTDRARDLTPETRPASTSQFPDALAPWITDIRRERDGSVTLTLGVRTGRTQRPPVPRAGEMPLAGSSATRIDPITGETVTYSTGPGALPPPPPPSDGRR